MKDQFSPTGGGIYIFRDALKPDLPVIKLCDGFDEVLERPAKPVEPPDNEGIS